jgi:hypothetical protein
VIVIGQPPVTPIYHPLSFGFGESTNCVIIGMTVNTDKTKVMIIKSNKITYEGYQAEIFKIGGPILIPHIHKLFNLAVKQGFPKPWMQSLIVPIF